LPTNISRQNVGVLTSLTHYSRPLQAQGEVSMNADTLSITLFQMPSHVAGLYDNAGAKLSTKWKQTRTSHVVLVVMLPISLPRYDVDIRISGHGEHRSEGMEVVVSANFTRITVKSLYCVDWEGRWGELG
jgi:hypothetical protein